MDQAQVLLYVILPLCVAVAGPCIACCISDCVSRRGELRRRTEERNAAEQARLALEDRVAAVTAQARMAAAEDTTGKELCADGQKLRRRLNIGAISVVRHQGRLANRPSGQECRRRRPSWPDGIPSIQAWPSGQTLAVSQPFGPPNGVIQ
jgi:hypothetical protein